MSPAMKRTGCLILPPAFWKMLFVFLAAFLDQEMAQEKRLSTNRMGRWACLGGFFMIEANCLHVCMFLFFKNLFGGSPHRSMSQVCLKRIQVAPSFDSNLTELQGGLRQGCNYHPNTGKNPWHLNTSHRFGVISGGIQFGSLGRNTWFLQCSGLSPQTSGAK